MSKWTKRKRLEATIAGEAADRPPVALWRHWPGDDQDAAALAAAQLKWQQDYDWDFLKTSPASSYSVADWGLVDRWEGHIEGTRSYVEYPIKRPSDWETLSLLDPNQGMLGRQLEALRLTGEGLRGEVPFVATVFSVLGQARHLAGGETILSHMRSHPESFLQGLETIAENTVRFLDAARDSGMDGIYYAVSHARYPVMSQEEFSTFARPYDLRILESVSDLWLNVVHLHGTDIAFEWTADYPAQLFNWHDRDTAVTLADGLRQIRGAASGGVSQWSIHQEGPEQTLAEAREALEQTGGRRLVLGTGCVIMTTTPLRNIRALRESVSN